jgi:hypothetical protein
MAEGTCGDPAPAPSNCPCASEGQVGPDRYVVGWGLGGAGHGGVARPKGAVLAAPGALAENPAARRGGEQLGAEQDLVDLLGLVALPKVPGRSSAVNSGLVVMSCRSVLSKRAESGEESGVSLKSPMRQIASDRAAAQATLGVDAWGPGVAWRRNARAKPPGASTTRPAARDQALIFDRIRRWGRTTSPGTNSRVTRRMPQRRGPRLAGVRTSKVRSPAKRP